MDENLTPTPVDAYRVMCPNCHELVFVALTRQGERLPADVEAEGDLRILDHESTCRATTQN